MHGLAIKLGLRIAGVKYHLGRESNVYAKALGVNVSISKLGETPKGKPVDIYKGKNLLREALTLKNIFITSLELGFIFVFNLDKETIFTKQPSSPSIFKLLNPKISLSLDNKTIKRKSDNMATYINKELPYSSELGQPSKKPRICYQR